MKFEDLFNQRTIVDLSFFNFRNAITAAYFATNELEVLKVNDNFKKFFPILGNVSNAYFPNILEQLGLPGPQIDEFVRGLNENGSVLIPQISIKIDDEIRVFSLLSARTTDDGFSYLNGVQGQFVDRTMETQLRREREELLNQRLRDQEMIEEKNRQLESLADRLAKYLSPQIYQSIFSNRQSGDNSYHRRNLTVMFSDIERFTDLTDMLEPERLARVINSYLSEMTSIAIDCGGTIDKFIGDAVMVFFGDPTTEGEAEDAMKCVDMALRMRARVEEMQNHWKRLGVPDGINVRIGIATGFCTVGNFGSEQRLDYTALGGPVNLAARLQAMSPTKEILIDEYTWGLIQDRVECSFFEEFQPKGFSRPVKTYKVAEFLSPEHRGKRHRYSHRGDHVEVNVVNNADIRAAVKELRRIQEDLERQARDDETT